MMKDLMKNANQRRTALVFTSHQIRKRMKRGSPSSNAAAIVGQRKQPRNAAIVFSSSGKVAALGTTCVTQESIAVGKIAPNSAMERCLIDLRDQSTSKSGTQRRRSLFAHSLDGKNQV